MLIFVRLDLIIGTEMEMCGLVSPLCRVVVARQPSVCREEKEFLYLQTSSTMPHPRYFCQIYTAG